MTQPPQPPPKKGIFSGRYDRKFVEFACPVCNQRKIVCLPEESIPFCDYCKKEMVMKEDLTEGKY